MSFFRRFIVLASAFVLAAGLPALPAHADDVAAGQAMVKELMDSAQKDFGGKTVPAEERNAMVRAYIGKYASVPLSAQDVLGRYWSRATPEEQAEFQALMVDYAIGSWSGQLDGMPAATTIAFTSSETTPEGRTVLHSLVTSAGSNTPVDWQLARVADGRLVIADVAIDGAGMVQTMKADFSTIIRSNGGKVASLLDALKTKIASYKTTP